ncbi:MAG: DNA starvation/stationary phase protection protein [Akkermansiaceae bacterium]|nr:DNA starvation/stationary phase protection protein [Akkermansiaceae bacterium]MCP5546670.1 DNA starvation/stationary phase protection protein [Akkermansiaceae bacterium]
MTAKKSDSKQSHRSPVEIGLSAEACETSRDGLVRVLADQHVLYLKTRNFHWNLIGPRFSSLHGFFERLYQELEKSIDETAERIRMLGEASPGSMAEFLEQATLKEVAGGRIKGEDAIAKLRDDHEQVIRNLREVVEKTGEAGDAGTEDFLIGLLRSHEQAAWMLRSYLT